MKQGKHPGLSPRCPHCMAKLDGWTHDAQAEPKDGDFTICLYCAALGVFTRTPSGLLIRRPTERERAEAETHAALRHALIVARTYAAIWRQR
jgi:hypothetical protein